MMKVNSFDIFDTLLARNVKDPTDIFLIVELTYPYPNFKNLRLTAQNNSNHLMDDIYNQFQTITGETNEVIQSLREFELKTEMENTIPIMTNISKIKDGDIFVSDMYLSHNEIIRLYFSTSISDLRSEEVNILNETSENKRSDCRKFDKNIDGWSRSVLKWISDGISNDSSYV
jgi:hypothetical protein